MSTPITQQELDLLAGYPSEIEQRDPGRYNYLGQDAAVLCRIKDRTMALFDKRYRAAREVIDLQSSPSSNPISAAAVKR